MTRSDEKKSKKKEDHNTLEEAIYTWSTAEQKEFLLRHEKPGWGSKRIMTQRILGFVTIDKAVLIVAEYKEFLSRNKEILEDMMDEEEGDGENKRIKIVAKLRLEESRKQGDG